MTIKKTQSNKR